MFIPQVVDIRIGRNRILCSPIAHLPCCSLQLSQGITYSTLVLPDVVFLSDCVFVLPVLYCFLKRIVVDIFYQIVVAIR